MRTLTKKMASWLRVDSESGVTAIEYGLIAALIAIGIVVILGTVGTSLSTIFNSVNTSLQ